MTKTQHRVLSRALIILILGMTAYVSAQLGTEIGIQHAQAAQVVNTPKADVTQTQPRIHIPSLGKAQ